MRIKLNSDGSLCLWLSANDTYQWARRWPCSTIGGKRLFAGFESNGDLIDVAIAGRADTDCDSQEFDAITSDFIASKYPTHPAIKSPVEEN